MTLPPQPSHDPHGPPRHKKILSYFITFFSRFLACFVFFNGENKLYLVKQISNDYFSLVIKPNYVTQPISLGYNKMVKEIKIHLIH